jgi:hypothetical protein
MQPLSLLLFMVRVIDISSCRAVTLVSPKIDLFLPRCQHHVYTHDMLISDLETAFDVVFSLCIYFIRTLSERKMLFDSNPFQTPHMCSTLLQDLMVPPGSSNMELAAPGLVGEQPKSFSVSSLSPGGVDKGVGHSPKLIRPSSDVTLIEIQLQLNSNAQVCMHLC